MWSCRWLLHRLEIWRAADHLHTYSGCVQCFFNLYRFLQAVTEHINGKIHIKVMQQRRPRQRMIFCPSAYCDAFFSTTILAAKHVLTEHDREVSSWPRLSFVWTKIDSIPYVHRRPCCDSVGWSNVSIKPAVRGGAIWEKNYHRANRFIIALLNLRFVRKISKDENCS